MQKGLLFWLIFIVCLLFGGFWCFHGDAYRGYGVPMGIDFILIGLLGWGVYGPAVK